MLTRDAAGWMRRLMASKSVPYPVKITISPSRTARLGLIGRIADDLRISVTDRCNFRCVYCMPAAGLPWLAREEVLTFEEIVRLTRILVEQSGVRTIRLTGGEPLVRKGIEDLTRMIAAIDPSLDIAMTTNGILLEEKAAALRAAGLKRLNVSLDTL